MAKLGLLKQFEPREYWKDEAKEFTPWLFDNIHLLREPLHLPGLVAEGMEVSVGSYKADIVGKDTISGRKVVIENQLEETNHIHLGQIITYASGLKAEIAIWVVKEATDEHRQAIQWLNEIAGQNAAFFLVEIQLWQIGDSDLAPKFNVAVQPNRWTQVVEEQEKNRQLSAYEEINFEFWTLFINTAFGISDQFDQTFKPKNVSARGYLNLYTKGKRKIVLRIHAHGSDALGIRVYIKSSNPQWFDSVCSHKEEIEKALSAPLSISDTNSSYGTKWRGFWIYKPGCPIEAKDQWPSYIRWFVDMAPKAKSLVLEYLSVDNESDESDDLEDDTPDDES